jgi:hypothetical protein
MKKLLIFAIVLSVLAITPVIASAASVEGSVQGYQCVTQGITCPVGQEDPLAAVEDVFVLLEKSGKYYFVPNVDRAVLARHINERVKITGSMNEKYNSISATKIEAFAGGNWKTVWTSVLESKLLRKLAP